MASKTIRLTKDAARVLADILSNTNEVDKEPGVDSIYYRSKNPDDRSILDALEGERLIEKRDHQRYQLTLLGLSVLGNAKAKELLATCRRVFTAMHEHYRKDAKKQVLISELAIGLGVSTSEVIKALVYMRNARIWGGYSTDLTEPSASIGAGESILDYHDFNEVLAELSQQHLNTRPKNPSIYSGLKTKNLSKVPKKRQSTDTPQTENSVSVSVSTLSDAPASIDHDSLEYQAYSSAIVDFLVHTNTKAPFSLGITGPWGSGKTTLLSWIRDEIRKRNYQTVWFSPWKYNQSDEVWASFARVITETLIASPWDKMRLRLERFKKPLPSRQIRRYLLFLSLAIALTALIGSLLAGPDYLYVLAALILPAVPFVPSVWKAVSSPLLKMLASTKGPDYDRVLGFQREFEDDFSTIIDITVKADKTLFIFIDDLDRAPPPVPVKLLEAMNTLIGQERCIFVVGLDIAIVGASVEAKYLSVIQRMDPKIPGFTGADFIEKLVQLEFSLPALTERQLDSFIEATLRHSKPDTPTAQSTIGQSLPEPVAKTGGTIDSQPTSRHSERGLAAKFDEDNKDFTNSIFLFCRAIPRNPRKIKRFINQYRLVAYIAARRGLFSNGRVDIEGLGASVVLAAEYAEIYRLLGTAHFEDKLSDIIVWLGSGARGGRKIPDETIQSYGLSRSKEEYRYVSTVLVKLLDRAEWIGDYLSLSAVVSTGS